MHRVLIIALAGAVVFILSCIPRTTDRPYGLPIVCITFDDAHPTVWSVAFPCMQSIDSAMAATHFVPAGFIDAAGAGPGITIDKLKKMEAAGWETAGHTWHHADLTAIPCDSAKKEIDSCHAFLVRNGLRHGSFAYPIGDYNAEIQSLAAQRFVNLRTAHDLLYTTGVNRKELGYFAVKGTHSADDIIARVERARGLGSPLVIIGFHAVLTDTEPPEPVVYWTRQSIFLTFLRYLKEQGLPILTIEQAMDVLGEN